MTAAVRVMAVGLVAGLACWPVPGQARQQPQTPTFRSGIEAVRIDVLAVDHGKPIPALTAADFVVKDNGVVQKVDLATVAGHVSLVIALDVKGSWRQENQELVRAARALAHALEPVDRAWLVTFAQDVSLKARPSENQKEMLTALEHVATGPGKSFWDALFDSATLVAGHDGRALVIVVSDGQVTYRKTDWLDEKRSLDLLKRGEVTITAVQPRSALASQNALKRAATATGGVLLEAEHTDQLAAQFTKLLGDYRLGYVLTFTPTGVAHGDGWHKLSVELKDRSGKVTARQGYYSGPR